MRIVFVALLTFCCLGATAGQYENDSLPDKKTENFLSFNPLALAEPQMAVGVGFGYRWTRRSEWFTELSVLTDNPFYGEIDNNISGLRIITQYRYHFPRPLLGFARRFQSDGSFISVEARLKNYRFSGTENFIHATTNNTLNLYPYEAGAVVFGGAILWGDVYELNRSGSLRLEVSAGIGARQKKVQFKNVPDGFQVRESFREWGFVPRIYQSAGSLYLPFAVRLQYRLSKQAFR